MEIEIAQVEVMKLDVEPGDILVISLKHTWHPEVLAEIRNKFLSVLPRGVEVVLMNANDASLSIIRPSARDDLYKLLRSGQQTSI
jgi:hypothetical protein